MQTIGALIAAVFIGIVALTGGMMACGSSGPMQYASDVPTNAPPIVTRVDPTSGPIGTAVTIYGFGFSFAPDLNAITIGQAMAVADTYTFLEVPTSEEIESLTTTVPAEAVEGASPVVVLVHEIPSNADIFFTVTP